MKQIATKLTPLPANGPLRVSVNSFGYGGTNAHIILEAASPPSRLQRGPKETSLEADWSVVDSMVNGSKTKQLHYQSSKFPISNGYVDGKVGKSDLIEATTNGTKSTNDANYLKVQIGAVDYVAPKSPSGLNGVNGNHSARSRIENGHGLSYDPELFVLSAKSENSLQTMVANLQKWTSDQDRSSRFHDLAYTLSVRRTAMQFRFSTVAANYAELLTSLKQKPHITKAEKRINCIFIFTGQGAQWFAMARELNISHKLFRSSMLKSDKILKDLGAKWSLIDELSKDEKFTRVGEAEISQPSTTAIQIALIILLRSFGVFPDIVLGHSSGEIAAAFAADALDHETALEISYHRGFMSKACARVISGKGAMMAVGLGAYDLEKYINQTITGIVSIACINSPTSTTISGDESAIDELKLILNDASIFNRKLKVDTAYHSHHMKKVAVEYRQSIIHIKSQTPNPSVKFYSSVTSVKKAENFNADYWTDNLISPVRFGDTLELICRKELSGSDPGGVVPLNLFIEIGPHSALAGPVRQVINSLGLTTFKSHYLSTLVRDRNSVVALLEAAGKLFEFGYPVSLEATLGQQHGNKVPELISDLAPYPWDHSTGYFFESNLSKQHRFRAHPPHDLLGLRVTGTTIHEPSWRNLVGIDSLPWLRDHVVDGFIIYPGAAYLCMAIEGVRQISIDRQIVGVMSQIKFKNVSFSKAIVIPEQRPDGLTPDVEVMLTLKPEKNLADRTWESFRILALSSDDVWSEHCSGSIMVEWTGKLDEVEGLREGNMSTLHQLEQLQSMKDACDTQYTGAELYQSFADNGNVFGPTFSNVQKAQIGPDVGVCEVTLPDIASVMPAKYQQPHLIHPASFDAISHLGMPLYRRNTGNGPVMPTGMEEVTIYCNIGCSPGTNWVVATTMNSTGARSAVMDTMVFEETGGDSPIPIITIRGGALRGIGEAASVQSTLPFHRKMSYRLKWQPDVEFTPKKEINTTLDENGDSLDVCTKYSDIVVDKIHSLSSPMQLVSTPEEMALYEIAATIYIKDCLSKIHGIDRESMKPHLQKLLNWMRMYDAKISHELHGRLSEHDTAIYLQRAREAGVEGLMLTRVGESLSSILSGIADPLSLMLEGDLLARFYSNGLIVPNYLQMVEYVRLLVFKHPHMKVLEIGAGTGGATLPLIQSLDREEGILFDRYHYTDISAGFFEQAKALLHDWIDRIDFKTLDISKDPIQQGFQEHAYDLIIASNVLHATSCLDETVANSRKLLKPGGRLILIELTRLTAHINIIFGTLAGWWASKDGRQDCPLLSKNQWDATLMRHGFDGVAVAMPDHEGPTARSLMIVSKAINPKVPLSQAAVLPAIEIICQSQSDGYLCFAQDLLLRLSELGYHCSRRGWTSRPIDLNLIYIVLDDVTEPVLVGPSQERFQQVVSLVTRAKNVLWISCQESSTDTHNPVKGLVNGLARVVRRENEGMRFVTIDVQENITSSGTLVSMLSEVITKSFPTADDAIKSFEDEYSFSGNQLLIPRVHADRKFDDWVKRSIYPQNMETGQYHQLERPLKLEVETPGLLSSLRFVDDDLPSKPMGPYDLELEVKAHGINFKDVFIAMGQMVPGVTMAGECAGIVQQVGSALTEKFHVGERVCGIGAQPFSSRPRVDGNFSHQMPTGMTFAVGASIPVIFTTAYYCIVEVAHLQPGQTILIHAASGGVGQAAIQLAQSVGAEIFCTVGSAAKRKLLIDHFNIEPNHIFSSRLRTFKQGILRLTKNKGVDCVLNSLSGESLHDSFSILAPLGTFVEIGKSDIYKKNEISLVPFDRNVTFAAVDLTVLGRLKPVEMQERLGKVLSLFEQGVLTPVLPITSMPIGDIEEAFRMIQSRKHTGKLVVICDEEMRVKVTTERPKPLNLDQNGSYVIAGGLGDLGRRIARFLAAHGAGNVITLSRRTLKEDDQLAFQNEIDKLGAKLHVVKCDITSREDVQSAAAKYSASLPPIKGLIHGGMILRVQFSHTLLDCPFLTLLGPSV